MPTRRFFIRASVLAISTVALLRGVTSLGVPSDADPTAAIAHRFAELYLQRRFSEASALFHCPPEYTAEQEAADRKAVARSLEILWRLNGPVHSIRPAGPSVTIGAVTACGTAAYWKSHPTAVRRVLETSQRVDEQGYLEFEFADVLGRPLLAYFSHSLAVSHPEARSRPRAFLDIKLADYGDPNRN